MTSEYEGLPLTLIESISYGVIPIVYASFSSVYDIVENNKNGILIPKESTGYNQKQMVKEISTLIENNHLKEELGYNAYQSSKNFDIKYIYNKWNNLFNQYTS